MLVETHYEHIGLNDAGVPTITGTTMKVVELVLEYLSHGWSAEEIHFQHPYLSMAQVHSALAYYWDHKNELDEDIQRRLEAVDAIQKSTPVSPAVERLRAARST
jgi:uncharacterized protein (DUF433 family)